MSQKKKKTIVIDGVRYHADRPASCKDCYFWKNNKTGCVLGKDKWICRFSDDHFLFLIC